jgi:hypothetical protein
MPSTANEAVGLAEVGCLAIPQAVRVRSVTGEPYDRIVGYTLGDKPPPITASDMAGPEPQLVPAVEDDIPF